MIKARIGENSNRINLKDIVDIAALQSLMESLYQASGFMCGLVAVDGEILVAVGWQDLCQKFFRCHPATAKLCQESDISIAGDLAKGKFSLYECANGLYDMATPIIIDDVHVATMFLGQFLFRPPDRDKFGRIADRYSFPREAFMEAVDKIPIIAEAQANRIMVFYAELAGMIVDLGQKGLHEMRQAKKIEEASLRLRQVYETTQDGIWEWDIATGEIQFTDQYYTMLGYEPGELPASFATWQNLLHPDDVEPSLVIVHRYLANGGSGFDMEFRMRHKNGSYRWIMGRGRTVEQASDGSPLNVVGIHIDITLQKMKERELEQYNQELSQLVAERTARLEDYAKELEAFSYSVSHDLRSPLRAIDGFATALEEDYGAELNLEARDYLQRMRNASQKMGYLIDDLLKLSGITRKELLFSRVDLSVICYDLRDELMSREPARQIDWEIEAGLAIRGDKGLLRVVMNNLLENAWKYTRDSQDATIKVYQKNVEGCQMICVADNGIGFEMKYADKLFGPFQRLHSHQDWPGNGIGLATVQRIVHRHGGMIRGEGSLGKGSTFSFYLGNEDALQEGPPGLVTQAPAGWR
jgi:PAS domain S-box-containing protein